MQEYTNHSDTTFALRNISFRVPGRTLLHPLSLTFPAGKVTGLIGHNGSGKSTLLKMLGRHQPPSEGEILLDAQPLESWSSKAFARKVAYLPQQLPPAEGMTVRELVAIGRYPWHGALGRFGAADREKVEEAISLVGLKPLAHRLVDSLSGGERQRAWIAMLVAQDSRCLLLDEPTSALDIAHQVDVLALVHRLSQERGLTVIAVLRQLGYSHEAISGYMSRAAVVATRHMEEQVGDVKLVRQMSKEKNALAGSRTFQYIAQRPGTKELLLMMNCLGDAHHWSENTCWIFDADFEYLCNDSVVQLVCTGARCRDYKLRLLMAGVPEERIVCQPDEFRAAELLHYAPGDDVYILYGTDSLALSYKVYDHMKEEAARHAQDGAEKEAQA